MNRTEQEGTEMEKQMMAVIGYWSEYHEKNILNTAHFMVNDQKVTIFYKPKSKTFIIGYRWLLTPVYYDEIFDTLDLYEEMLKGMNNNVGVD